MLFYEFPMSTQSVPLGDLCRKPAINLLCLHVTPQLERHIPSIPSSFCILNPRHMPCVHIASSFCPISIGHSPPMTVFCPRPSQDCQCFLPQLVVFTPSWPHSTRTPHAEPSGMCHVARRYDLALLPRVLSRALARQETSHAQTQLTRLCSPAPLNTPSPSHAIFHPTDDLEARNSTQDRRFHCS